MASSSKRNVEAFEKIFAQGFTTQSDAGITQACVEQLNLARHASHEDLLAFLSAVQTLEIDIPPLMWYPPLEINRGGFSKINEYVFHDQLSFAFKRRNIVTVLRQNRKILVR
jgi:hypothetical protein